MKRLAMVMIMAVAAIGAAAAEGTAREIAEHRAEQAIERNVIPAMIAELWAIYMNGSTTDDEKNAAVDAMVAEFVIQAADIYRAEYAAVGIDPPADFESRMDAIFDEMMGDM